MKFDWTPEAAPSMLERTTEEFGKIPNSRLAKVCIIGGGIYLSFLIPGLIYAEGDSWDGHASYFGVVAYFCLGCVIAVSLMLKTELTSPPFLQSVASFGPIARIFTGIAFTGAVVPFIYLPLPGWNELLDDTGPVRVCVLLEEKWSDGPIGDARFGLTFSAAEPWPKSRSLENSWPWYDRVTAGDSLIVIARKGRFDWPVILDMERPRPGECRRL